MRFPVKLNRAYWPAVLTKVIPSAVDPRILCSTNVVDENSFTSAVSSFKFGATFKSTQKARFPLTILELSTLTYPSRPIIIDIGASDGITSLDVMQAIPFEKYYVTDMNIEVSYQVSGDTTWFYDEKGDCILMVTDKWVNYPDTGGAVFPFDKIAQALFSCAPKPEINAPRITLINPLFKTQNKSNVLIEKHNILETWPHEKADLIIAANILNRGYFTASEIEHALNKLVAALNVAGKIVIIDNRPSERATIFQINEGNVKIVKRVNGGTEIESLAVNIFAKIIRSSQTNSAAGQV
jgi:hypothetical protein